MIPRPLMVGEIVQIRPDATNGGGAKNGLEWFGACLMVVTETKAFGAVGYVKNAGSNGCHYVRVGFEDMEPVGALVVWMSEDEQETTEEVAGMQASGEPS